MAVRTSPGTAALSMVGGRLGVVHATGPLAASGDLRVSARAGISTVEGTIANPGPDPVDDVAVFLGTRAVTVGRLPPGATRRWRIDLTDPTVAGNAFRPVESRVWPKAFARATSGRVAIEGTGPVNLALWGALLAAAGPNLRAPGAVVAAGWTGTLDPPIDRDGGIPGRAVVAVRTPVEPSGGGLTGWEVPRQQLRGPVTTRLTGRAGTPVEGAVVRFTLPAPSTGAPLVFSVPAAVDVIEVWMAGRWVGLRLPISSADPAAGPRLLAVPPGARLGDVVHVRLGVRTDAAPSAAGDLVLRSRP